MPAADSRLRELGRVLRLARSDRNLRLREVAPRAGVGISTLAAYETGGKEPSALRLLDVCTVLGVDVERLRSRLGVARRRAA